MCAKPVNHLLPARAQSDRERRLSVIVGRVHVRSVRDQEICQIEAALESCFVHRRITELLARVGHGAARKQESSYFDMRARRG